MVNRDNVPPKSLEILTRSGVQTWNCACEWYKRLWIIKGESPQGLVAVTMFRYFVQKREFCFFCQHLKRAQFSKIAPCPINIFHQNEFCYVLGIEEVSLLFTYRGLFLLYKIGSYCCSIILVTRFVPQKSFRDRRFSLQKMYQRIWLW